MQVTIELDPEVYSKASTYAHAHGLDFSAALNEMVRQAEQVPPPPSPRLIRNQYGILVATGTGGVITSEMVKEFSEDPFE